MKKYLLLLMLPLLTGTGFAMGQKPPEGVSLLLVPARSSLVQLGMDMAAQRHAVLMSYATGTSENQLFLHIWDGSKWLRVPQASYENGSFLKNAASQILVVGDETDLTASLIKKGLLWCPEVLHLGTTNITELINQMGRLYGFNRKDWEWIATRYDLKLEDLNQNRPPHTSWYDDNKASNLPPSEKPWKKDASQTSVQPPEISLRPVMPPVVEKQSPPTEVKKLPVKTDAPEVKGTPNPAAVELDSPVVGAPADFSLEVE